MRVKSEAFKNTYAIFVSPKVVPTYKGIIERNNIEQADIFKATFDNTIAMITIPHNSKAKEIESILFKQSNEGKGEGFWGQVGVGYEGKVWEKYD